jgi:CubicO group peptidase (beta-lactamase class C family)
VAAFPESVTNRLEQLLERVLSRKSIRQAVLGAESLDGALRWAGAGGEAAPDGSPVLAETPFFLASIDKLWNATIAPRLSERGLLDLDSPVTSYLPPDLTRGLHRLDGVDYTGRITVRHLLSHTSGLADWLEDRPQGGRSLVDRIVTDGDRELGLEDVSGIVRESSSPISRRRTCPPVAAGSGTRTPTSC